MFSFVAKTALRVSFLRNHNFSVAHGEGTEKEKAKASLSVCLGKNFDCDGYDLVEAILPESQYMLEEFCYHESNEQKPGLKKQLLVLISKVSAAPGDNVLVL